MTFAEDARREWDAVLHNFADRPEAEAYMATRIPFLRARAEEWVKRVHERAHILYPA